MTSLRKNCVKSKEDEGAMIINEGMIFYITKGKKHIRFFKNEFGRKLKQMWKQLNKPIRRK